MSELDWFKALFERFPDFDGTWSTEIREKWWTCYWELFSLGCSIEREKKGQKGTLVKLIQITVSYGQTQSLPEYSNVKPLISLTATLDESDDPAEVEALLKAHAKASIHEQIDDALELNGLAAKYSTEPRYQVMRTYWDSYLNRGKPEPPKLIIILPNELDPDKRSLGVGLIHSGYPESRKLRKVHAIRVAWDSARDLGAVLIDCADGDLTPLIQALADDNADEELDADAEAAEREQELSKGPL